MANAKINKSLIGSRPSLTRAGKSKTPTAKKVKSILKTSDDIIDMLVVIPPDGGWGWAVVFASFACNFVADGTMFTFGIFLQDISESLNAPKTQVAMANSFMSGIYYVCGPLVSGLTNKYGFRMVAFLGGILATTAFVLSSYCESLFVFYLTFGLLGGFGFGMVYVPSVIVVGFYFERWRALATAIAVCGSSAGMIAIPIIMKYAFEGLTWREKFRYLGGAGVICSLLAFIYRPLHPIRATPDDRRVQFAFDDLDSIGDFSLEEERSGLLANIFNKYRNTSYPTSADLCGKSTITLTSTKRVFGDSALLSSTVPSATVSRASVKSNRSGKSSVKGSARPKMSLATVYESNEDDGQCAKCGRIINKVLCCGCLQDKAVPPSRPMYRDDIFYGGSLMLVPEYTRSVGSMASRRDKSAVDYHLSVTRAATQQDMDEDDNACVFCPQALIRTLATMLDFTIVLKSRAFLIVCLSGVLTTLGMYAPFMFVEDRAIENGMRESYSTYLLSVIGIANIFGRVTSGVLASLPKVNALMYSCISLCVCGVATIFSTLEYSAMYQYGYAITFGFTVACISSIRAVILADLVGLEKLTNAFGVALMFQGVAAFSGVPIAGFLREFTGGYDITFYFCGGCILCSGMLLLPVKKISNWEKAKSNAPNPDTNESVVQKINY